MRILHVITSMDTGGAERLMVDLLPLLSDRGHDIGLLLFNGVDTPLKASLAAKGVKIFELAKTGSVDDQWVIYNPLNVFKMMKLIKNYDIIHTHNTACQLYVPMAKILCRSRATLMTTEHNTTNRRRNMGWFRPIDRWMYGRYAAIICISDQAHDNLEQYIGSSPTLHTIYNGVKINDFEKPVKRIDNQQQFVITMVAGFRKQKDHETLIKSMLRLPDNYLLQLVGRGETEQDIKDLCHSLGLESRVSFLGVRSDVPEILEKSDVTVLSSHWEGLSLSSIEGMASGRPFIASDVDGLHEMVGGAGVLFPRGDEKALAGAIRGLCENPTRYHEVAIACQQRAKCYDISKMADGYDNLYRSFQ